jgi:hypothetical protein
VIEADIPEELLTQKIRGYRNFGKTVGPGNLIAVLEDRCTENFGVFAERSDDDDD